MTTKSTRSKTDRSILKVSQFHVTSGWNLRCSKTAWLKVLNFHGNRTWRWCFCGSVYIGWIVILRHLFGFTRSSPIPRERRWAERAGLSDVWNRFPALFGVLSWTSNTHEHLSFFDICFKITWGQPHIFVTHSIISNYWMSESKTWVQRQLRSCLDKYKRCRRVNLTLDTLKLKGCKLLAIKASCRSFPPLLYTPLSNFYLWPLLVLKDTCSIFSPSR